MPNQPAKIFYWLCPVALALSTICGCYPSVADNPKNPHSAPQKIEATPLTPLADASSDALQVADIPLPTEIYAGKYAQDARFSSLDKRVPLLRQQAMEKLAGRLGLAEPPAIPIVVTWRDWQTSDRERCFHIRQEMVAGRLYWQLVLISEYFVNGSEKAEWLLPYAWNETIFTVATTHRTNPLPAWLKAGIAHFASGEEGESLPRLLLPLIEGKQSLGEVLPGLLPEQKETLALQGYLALLYWQDAYGLESLKTFMQRAVWQDRPWETELTAITQSDFFGFQEKAKNFALALLGSRYWPHVISYRKALREYLQNDYLATIANFKKLDIDLPASWLSGDIWFWLGMAYYRSERHYDAAGYFAQVYERAPYPAIHLATAQYREAMCFYRLQKLAEAIGACERFGRDFPYHELAGSAQFFLAAGLTQRGETRRAYAAYAQFLGRFPKHERVFAAHMAAAALCEKLGWLAYAKSHYQSVANHAGDPAKTQAQERNKEIAAVEEAGPSPELMRVLVESEEKFAKQNSSQQEVALEELGRIGKLALPTLTRLSDRLSTPLSKRLVAILGDMHEGAATPLFLKIMRREPTLSQEAWQGLISLRLPPSFLHQMAQREFSDLAAGSREQIAASLLRVLWHVEDGLLQELPDLLCRLNGDAHGQITAIEQMTLHARAEQIPVLLLLAEYGQSEEVMRQAVQSLAAWHDARAMPVLRRLAIHKSRTLSLAAVQSLAALGDYPLAALRQMAASPLAEVREAALDILARANTPEHQRVLLALLEDPLLYLRDKTHATLARIPVQALLPALAQGFAEDDHSLYFYTGIVSLVENCLKRAVFYRPDMKREERIRLAAEWQQK
jgi:TolA-binding protein